MNHISANSPQWFEEAQNKVGTEIAAELAELEKKIRSEVFQAQQERLDKANLVQKPFIKREIEKLIKVQFKEVSATLFAQRGIPQVSAESLW